MIEILAVLQAEQRLIELRRQYEAEGAPLDPRKVRADIAYLQQQINDVANEVARILAWFNDCETRQLLP